MGRRCDDVVATGLLDDSPGNERDAQTGGDEPEDCLVVGRPDRGEPGPEAEVTRTFGDGVHLLVYQRAT